ncbi:acyl-CoA dehydrogenase C-terminal domain-containing protein [Saccharophagus degradans]|uniref:3-methylmercaptopropionyl-CoA dehydrogenase n=1 Tax=Saccharophagus degradans TaxID=86304 RepID=A0AAW7X3W0_9GAMM|nr:acyl-CoA dehydrogenase C-terminal domain-containing protein [Saccharophagus degradans]MDO6421301.1 acyl-CoA dehydrogenase C-terminal domain-containing protein [Saccharophagus degradans]MDO6605788.1 acyl-CoA dehydrogenase C-terminal domain-containing protein [Saccharophagus degradans]WGO96609.1 acyl-CoA dehydrogenase C-terminal domain-containing protein [Saccharophagus degradans]
MSDYKAPIRDIKFVMYELMGFEEHYQTMPNGEDASQDVVEAILEESAKFCENVLAPLNSVGDEQGCTWNDGVVTTPDGFKAAYEQFVEAGWPSMTHHTEYGGQGLPESLGTVLSEMTGTSNWAWCMYPGLSHGAMKTLELHGTEEQKSTYLTKLVEGAWTGTMCLTEAHCGTDLGMLRTKAEPNEDGSYAISGTKIFISAGEHDLAENIVHIVLARLPGAPEGTKGISLFIVPKFLPSDDGSVGERNQVACGSLEEKMGIHGNATCVMNFDGAKGYLIGPPNKGLNCMFTFMNTARLGTALQGLAHAELGYQKSLAYAKDRIQMRALSGVKNPDGPADPIICHPDVRRMLLTQKAFAEGGRMLIYFLAKQVDIESHAQNEADKAAASDMLALLTPIAKAFLTETGFESANLAVQCFGGHGYIREWGAEQNVRDARISMLYEGTTGIQALDLLGRKVLMSQGEVLRKFTKVIHKFCEANKDNAAISEFVEPLAQLNKEWGDVTMHIGLAAMENPEEVGAASVDYLMYSGYITLAYFWAQAALVASANLESSEKDYYASKIKTARFYYQRLLPRTQSLVTTMKSGAANLLDLTLEEF